MARVLEDFTTYTETDAPGRITVNSSIRSTVLDGDRDEAFYLYFDKGVDFFNGDFEHWATFNATDNALYAGAYWGVSNSVAAFAQQTNSIALFSGNAVVFLIRERDGGTEYDSGVYSFTGGTDYYFKLIRDEAIGTYGTMYAYIYSDVGRTNLLSTLSLALHSSKKDFRYIYAVQGYNDGVGGRDWDGYIDSLSLSEAVANSAFLTFMGPQPQQ